MTARASYACAQVGETSLSSWTPINTDLASSRRQAAGRWEGVGRDGRRHDGHYAEARRRQVPPLAGRARHPPVLQRLPQHLYQCAHPSDPPPPLRLRDPHGSCARRAHPPRLTVPHACQGFLLLLPFASTAIVIVFVAIFCKWRKGLYVFILASFVMFVSCAPGAMMDAARARLQCDAHAAARAFSLSTGGVAHARSAGCLPNAGSGVQRAGETTAATHPSCACSGWRPRRHRRAPPARAGRARVASLARTLTRCRIPGAGYG